VFERKTVPAGLAKSSVTRSENSSFLLAHERYSASATPWEFLT
jgi:hypothetical protein